MRDTGNWARLLAFVTGLVNQELLLQNEYLAAENRILKAHLPSRLRLSDPERSTLAEIGKRLGRKRLKHVACTAKPDTILAWYRRLIARKFDGSKHRIYPGRPRVETAIEELVVRLAREIPTGAMTASSARWPTWAITFRTRQSATSCAATTSRPRRSEVRRPLGRSSSAGIWTCWLERTSSLWRC